MRLVPRQPAGPGAAHRLHASRGARRRTRSACSPSRRASGWSACCATCSTRTSSCRRYGIRSLSRVHREHPYVFDVDGQEYRVRLRAGRVRHRAVRRQLELARAGLVPGQLPAHRGAGALPPLLRRRRSRSSARPARAGCMNLQRGRARARARLAAPLPARRRRARGPCHGDDARYRGRPALAATSCCSTSTSTATPAAASARATRPAGPRSCSAASRTARRRPGDGSAVPPTESRRLAGSAR